MASGFISSFVENLPDKHTERRLFAIRYFFFTLGLMLFLRMLAEYLANYPIFQATIVYVFIAWWALLGLWYLMLDIRSKRIADTTGVILVALLTIMAIVIASQYGG